MTTLDFKIMKIDKSEDTWQKEARRAIWSLISFAFLARGVVCAKYDFSQMTILLIQQMLLAISCICCLTLTIVMARNSINMRHTKNLRDANKLANSSIEK